MVTIAEKLLEKAKPYFQEYKTLSAKCPKCKAPLVLKYASNPERHLRKLSLIVACKNNCDRSIWNTDGKEGFTHWWLDGPRDRKGYHGVIQSLPSNERKMVKKLEKQVRKINREYLNSLF
ncbi:MAG: hypothetical protein ACTSR2_07640 [Candidatus Hodarchaeales archaeon]